MTVCHEAPACRALLDQSDERAPDRRTTSDGVCASAAHHQQNPGSDHEPHVHRDDKDWATGVDVSDDKAGGCDADDLAERIRLRKDRRVKYVICNRRMFSSYPTSVCKAWEWRPYTGPNPHETHTHISVLPEYIYDTSDWWGTEDDMAWTDEDSKNLKRAADALEQINHHVSGAVDAAGGGPRLPRLLRAVDAIRVKLGA